MGNRAIVRFVDDPKDKTPDATAAEIYLHWNGGPESIYAFRDFAASRGMIGHDASYAVARLTSVCGLFFGHKDGTSLGVMAVGDGGVGHADDNGGFVFPVSNEPDVVCCARPDGPRSKKAIAAEAKVARADPKYLDITKRLQKMVDVLDAIDKIEDATLRVAA